MRSYITLTGLAAVILSTTIGSAFAAPHADHPDHVGDRRNHDRAGVYMALDPDQMVTNPIASVPLQVQQIAYKPRLAAVLDALRVDNRRIDNERARGHLTPVQSERLKAEDAKIRSEALLVASHNGGNLPPARYGALEQQIHQLNRTI